METTLSCNCSSDPTKAPQLHKIFVSKQLCGVVIYASHRRSLSCQIPKDLSLKMQRRIRQVFTALREQGCVGHAKVATIGGFCDLDLVIVKATAPNDLPLSERYVHQLLKIFSISPASFQAFSHSFTRRFGRTRCWRVALKCLLLLHRLLRMVPQDSPFRAELLWIRSNGLLSLYPCHFRDTSSSSSQDYTAFITFYAQLLDEAIDCFSMDDKATENGSEEFESLSDKMKEMGRVLEVLPQLQSLIDRVMDCRPTGSASRSFLIKSAMKHIIRDSFTCYSTFQREIVVVMDNLFQLPYRSCIAAFNIYKKAAVQAAQLCEFYDWCKAGGLCGSYEYPFIDRIPHLQIRALENVLHGMWQLTESSSSNTSSSSMLGSPSPSSFTEDDGDKQMVRTREIVVSPRWEKFEEDEEKPLLQLEVSNASWEALLEASIVVSRVPPNYLFWNSNGYSHVYNDQIKDPHEDSQLMDGWKMQIYNPFYHPQNMINYHGLERQVALQYHGDNGSSEKV